MQRKQYERLYYLSHLERYKGNNKQWYKSLTQVQKDNRKENNKNYVKRLRQEFLNAYGNKCNCCGETTQEFLTLDHIYNDGNLHRKGQIGGSRCYADLKHLGWPKDRYQLLCMNCNFAKRSGICPHQKVRTL